MDQDQLFRKSFHDEICFACRKGRAKSAAMLERILGKARICARLAGKPELLRHIVSSLRENARDAEADELDRGMIA